MDGVDSLMGKNLMGSHLKTTGTQLLLSEEPELMKRVRAGDRAEDLARDFPKSCLPWAMLAEAALNENRIIEGYAFARTGYHRGLDALRSIGWRGSGTIPYGHEPNRGFLRALRSLGSAAGLIGEHEEVARINEFICDADGMIA